jgi:hypothetical protein
VPVVIGKSTVHLYPDVHPLMHIAERAHAFHITTANLQTLRLPSDVYIDHLGMHLDSASTVAGLKHDFYQHFHDHWLDMTHLSVISFHNSAGAVQANAVTVADPSILKPVVDGPVNNCRPADVRFVRLELSLDFRPLCTAAGPNDQTILRTNYYVELPQTTTAILDGHGHGRNLTTFHGAADLRTLSVDQLTADILAHVPQGGPILLGESQPFVNSATIDDTTAWESISRAILKLAVPTVERTIFETLCPNYSAQPHAAVEGISQVTIDTEGNIQVLPVAQFHSVLQRASQPFASKAMYPVDLCSLFMRNLHDDVKAVFQELYPSYVDPVPLDGRTQRTTLAIILRHATNAENRVISTQRLVARQVGQTFLADSYASQAEKTLSRYNTPNSSPTKPSPSPTKTTTGTPRLGEGQSCHGCGSPHHPFSQCPQKDDPKIKAIARKNYDKQRKARRSDDGGAARKRWAAKNPNLDDLSPAARQKITRQVLEADASTSKEADDSSSVTSSITGGSFSPRHLASRGRGSGSRGGGTSGRAVFITNAIAFAARNKEVLPVPIASLLAHICVDTAASLCTGNSTFLFSIVKAYPECVAAIYAPEDYSPIILSGIVKRNGDAVTTALPVAFLFNLEYFTRDGQPAQLLVAAGPDVNVNLIFGNPMLQGTGAVIDYGDNVVECRALDTPPFPIEFRRARLTVPTPSETTARANLSEGLQSFIADVERLEAYVAAAFAPPAERQVRFQVDPPPSGIIQPPSVAACSNSSLPRESLNDFVEPAGESCDECDTSSE